VKSPSAPEATTASFWRIVFVTGDRWTVAPAESELPAQLPRSLTSDRGLGMADHKRSSIDSDMQV
jgi:hypothetical protein